MEKSIYEKELGDQFTKLHPMLQKRYDIRDGKLFIGKGTMYDIVGGPKILYPLWWFGTFFKLIFPEHGKQIPFTIKNKAYQTKKGEEHVHWERAFHFPTKTRYFNAVMSYDTKRKLIKDYLGEPSPLYSDLKLTVLNDGSLKIDSIKQRLMIGNIEIPLPKWMYGNATVYEGYDETHECYTIHVIVHNRIIGRVFSYKGIFHVYSYT